MGASRLGKRFDGIFKLIDSIGSVTTGLVTNPGTNLKKGFGIVTNLIPQILTAMDNLADPLKDDLKGVMGQVKHLTQIGGSFINAGGDDVDTEKILSALKKTGKDIADKVKKVLRGRFFGNGASPAMTLLCSDVLCPCRLEDPPCPIL